MNNPLNAFTVYASLALKTDEFFRQLNSAFRNITGTVAKSGTAVISTASAGGMELATQAGKDQVLTTIFNARDLK